MPIAFQHMTGLISAWLVLVCCCFTSADDALTQLKARQDLSSAEVEMIDAHLDVETWTLDQVKDLHSQGYASWMELQRQQLNVDSVQIRLDAAREFHSFLADVAAAKSNLKTCDGIVYRERTSIPIKVYIPGSVRMIGWIEGHNVAVEDEPEHVNPDLETAEKDLAKAQKRFEKLNDSSNGISKHRQGALLKLNLAKSQLKYITLLHADQPAPKLNSEQIAISFGDVKNFVTAEENEFLNEATALVSHAESTASGHVQIATELLERHQRRTDALRDLQSKGVVSKKEIEDSEKRVKEIQSQLDAFTKNQAIIRAAIPQIQGKIQISRQYSSVSNWPATVFNDAEFTAHLIELRQKHSEEKVNRAVAEKQLDLFETVLIRLKKAEKRSSETASSFLATLKKGQRNEISAYESKIKIANATMRVATEKQQILVQEETRFVMQVLAQDQAARNRLVSLQKNQSLSLSVIGLVGPTAVLSPSTTKIPATRFSYLETGKSFELYESSSFLFSYGNLDYVGSPYGTDSLYRYSLRPASSYLSSCNSLRTYSNPVGLQLDPQWMDYFRHNYTRNSYSTLPRGFPLHLYPNINHWSINSPMVGIYSAYPYGILRSDLRSRVPAGFSPWYLPGRSGPTHIRRNQFPYKSRSYRY